VFGLDIVRKTDLSNGFINIYTADLQHRHACAISNPGVQAFKYDQMNVSQ